MKLVTRGESYVATPESLFTCLDDLGVTGMHMNESSAMMIGSRLHMEYLTTWHTGVGTMYRWWGRVLGVKMDFTVIVSKWALGKEKIWETIGNAKMIIFSWYQMRLNVTSSGEKAVARLSIAYRRPKPWLYAFLSFCFANWYCRWCLKNMLADSRRILESSQGQRRGNAGTKK